MVKGGRGIGGCFGLLVEDVHMRSYCTRIHGHMIEIREGDLGGQTLLVDGAVVESRAMAGLWRSRVGFMTVITDETERPRRVEAMVVNSGRLGIERVMLLSVDGVERGPVKASKNGLSDGLLMCMHCGYDLSGLPVENGEIRCPECARHRGVE
jgi:hypothetical protein